jgi:hypothetical protein
LEQRFTNARSAGNLLRVDVSKRLVAGTLSSRAWFSAPIDDFLQMGSEMILGHIAAHADYDVLLTQRNTWLTQIEILRAALDRLAGSIFFEFTVPRIGKRIDVVLVVGATVFVIEFKVGEHNFARVALDQAWDYGLDLKNFHEASHGAAIVPILVATEASFTPPLHVVRDNDGVFRPLSVTPTQLRTALDAVLRQVQGEAIDASRWSTAPYHPTPTIVEAARSLYAQHSVEAIARFDAGAKNLRITSRRVEELADEAQRMRRKIICFVTGVPGAGKTLVGLNVATRRQDKDQPAHAVFLSGNGPLVAVLREALTRDEVTRRRANGEKVRKGKIGNSVEAFIQNVHHFRDEGLLEAHRPPIEHVVIFDEAQRAWNVRQTASFMRRKKNKPNFVQSEPEFLISYMNRHRDWAAIICLVGGGQEINTGEAGIDAWLDAITESFPDWHAYISSRLVDTEYAAGQVLAKLRERKTAHFDDSLHLAVSMRSFRAENVSEFVKALLDCETGRARDVLAKVIRRFPIAVTRDLPRAKQWIRDHARGSERFGLITSSKAQRLKPHAIDIRVEVNPVHWFLNGKEDTRSSYYLEDAATEFQVQGLEVDWACVTWDGDLRHAGSEWTYHDFRGSRWCNINNADNKVYLRNAYRVLLTRARQGMVLFIPNGEPSDPTRSPAYYDATFAYLASLGIPVL